jgi:hypothetical protein
MEATKTVTSDGKSVTINVSITVPLNKNKGMLEYEELIQHAVNQAGSMATEDVLSLFDADGSPITHDGKKYTSKGKVSKCYQTPYGEIKLDRHVYQSNAGGSTFCPLDNDARIINSATPKLAKMVSSKYSESCADHIIKDLSQNHGRHLSKHYIQTLSQSVGKLILEKKGWNYDVDVPIEDVSTIGISLDGTCMLLCGDSYRVAMVGSISLYNSEGERLHTLYTACPPEHGKETFYKTFDKDIKRIRKLYPQAVYVGVADGAADNWSFLQNRVDEQILDFFHASEYLTKVSKAVFKRSFEAKEWLDNACHMLKNDENGAKKVFKKLKYLQNKRISADKKEILKTSVTYFENHLHQMDYYKYTQKHYPIGSGVIEAACKVIIKQRLCNSGMKWTDNGTGTVLALRCFNKSDGMWEQFSNKVNRYGK